MSRIGKKPIEIPQEVEVKIESRKVTVRGPKGELFRETPSEIKIEVKDDQIFIFPQIETKQTKALWGLTRALLANMVRGVTEGFEKKLQLEGLGFKVLMEGQDLVLSVGFSHQIYVKSQEGLQFSSEKNIITISGIDKELVGQVAARIRKVRPPEPYKGKGIRYVGEVVMRKAGKKVATTAE